MLVEMTKRRGCLHCCRPLQHSGCCPPLRILQKVDGIVRLCLLGLPLLPDSQLNCAHQCFDQRAVVLLVLGVLLPERPQHFFQFTNRFNLRHLLHLTQLLLICLLGLNHCKMR